MNFNNDIEDELLQRAFDVDEELPLPEDYVLDEINSKSVEFLKNVDKERKLLSSNNQNSIIVDYMDIEFSLNVDNTSNFKENYKRLKIPQRWIDGIKIEFSKIKNYFETEYLSNGKNLSHSHSHPHIKNFNINEIISTNKLQKENIMNLPLPDDIIIGNLIPHMTNKICIKLISHFERLFIFSQNSYYTSLYTITLWIYFLLIMLKTPLIDEDNSILYSLNKNIVNQLKLNEDQSINLKIIHVIISEIFCQKIINL